MKPKWKKRRLEFTGQDEHRLRRGDLTLATVGPVEGRWYFHALVPGGVSVNTLGRVLSGEGGPRTWADPEQAKDAAAAWVAMAERLASEARAAT